MPAVDIGVDMPDVEVQRLALNVREAVPRRIYNRSNDINKFGATAHCR